METITLKKCEEGTIWVTSDEDQNGTESSFVKITDEKEQMMIALAEFLRFEPANVLNFESIQKIDEDENEEIETTPEERYNARTIEFVSSDGVYRIKDRLDDVFRIFGVVTVADLRDCLHESVIPSDDDYGWVDLSGFKTECHVITGYRLHVPRALPIA